MADDKKTDATKIREESQKAQGKINEQWAAFSKNAAYTDLIDYIDSQREMLRKYAEER